MSFRKVNNDNLNLERKSLILLFWGKKKYIIMLKYCHYRNIFSMLISPLMFILTYIIFEIFFLHFIFGMKKVQLHSTDSYYIIIFILFLIFYNIDFFQMIFFSIRFIVLLDKYLSWLYIHRDLIDFLKPFVQKLEEFYFFDQGNWWKL